MKKQPLITTILKAPGNRKDARYVAVNLALEIDVQYQKSKPGREGKTITIFKDLDNGFAIYIPLQNGAGEWENCPIYRWTKTKIGTTLEYDPRVIDIK